MSYKLMDLLGDRTSSFESASANRVNMVMSNLIDRAHDAMVASHENVEKYIVAFRGAVDAANQLNRVIAGDKAMLKYPAKINSSVVYYSHETHNILRLQIGLPEQANIGFEDVNANPVSALKLGLESKMETLKSFFRAIKEAFKRIIAWLAKYARAAQIWLTGVSRKAEAIKKAMGKLPNSASAKLTKEQAEKLENIAGFRAVVGASNTDIYKNAIARVDTVSKDFINNFIKVVIKEVKSGGGKPGWYKKFVGWFTDLIKKAIKNIFSGEDALGLNKAAIEALRDKAFKDAVERKLLGTGNSKDLLGLISLSRSSATFACVYVPEVDHDLEDKAESALRVMRRFKLNTITVKVKDVEGKLKSPMENYKEGANLTKARLSSLSQELDIGAKNLKDALKRGNDVINAANKAISEIEKSNEQNELVIEAMKIEASLRRNIVVDLVPKAMGAMLDIFKGVYAEASTVAGLLKVGGGFENSEGEEGDATPVVGGDEFTEDEVTDTEQYAEDVESIEEAVESEAPYEGELEGGDSNDESTDAPATEDDDGANEGGEDGEGDNGEGGGENNDGETDGDDDNSGEGEGVPSNEEYYRNLFA